MKLDMAGVSVTLAMPINRDPPLPTVCSLLATQHALMAANIPHAIQFTAGSSIIHHARSVAAYEFLQSNTNRLFWVDSDMEWQPQDFMRLLALSTRMDIVGAAYAQKREPVRVFIAGHSLPSSETNEYGCLAVEGLGMGFVVMHRKVIETLSEKAAKAKFPDIEEPIPYLFRGDISEGHARGEDAAFFADARNAGFTTFVDPSVTLGHVGQKTYSGRLIDYMVKLGDTNVAA